MPDIRSDLEKALENEGKGLEYLSREELIKIVVAVRKSYDELYDILENKAVDNIAFKKED